MRVVEQRAVTEFAPEAALKELCGGLGIGALLFSGAAGVLAGLGVYSFTGFGDWSGLILPLAVALVIGTFEEIIFRGIIFRISEEWLGTWFALLVSACIFWGCFISTVRTRRSSALFPLSLGQAF